MDVIKEIEAKLQKYPYVKFESRKGRLEIMPTTDSGFLISLLMNDVYHVYFEGWHEEFSDPLEALECLTFGLSRRCRLKVLSRGNRDYNWTLEFNDDNAWKEDSTTGLFFYPFWKERKVRYLQNDLID